jgi:general secretion pathway protein G
MKQNKSGFTIVEIVIVVVVIGILASIVIIGYNQVQARGRDSKRKADITNIVKALELYYSDNGSYPVASGTNSSVGPTWYSSDTSSWSSFVSTLTGVMDIVPSDPRNSVGDVTSSSSAFSYAYFGGDYCGSAMGQMYILVYRYEASPQDQYTDGNCATNAIGPAFYAQGASYYRNSK